MWFGAGRGASNALVVLFGSGVGACLVTPQVEHGRAVEWGHLTVRVRGRRCRCGALGCLEAYAGAESLLARWREEGGRVPEGTDEETALTGMLAAAYPADGAAADPVALSVLEETAEYLGAGLSDLINLFQPERILMGGWAGLQLGSRFLPAVRRHALSYALRHPAQKVTIELGRLGPDAVTVGAAILPLADFFTRGGRRPTPTPRSRPPPGTRPSRNASPAEPRGFAVTHPAPGRRLGPRAARDGTWEVCSAPGCARLAPTLSRGPSGDASRAGRDTGCRSASGRMLRCRAARCSGDPGGPPGAGPERRRASGPVTRPAPGRPVYGDASLAGGVSRAGVVGPTARTFPRR